MINYYLKLTFIILELEKRTRAVFTQAKKEFLVQIIDDYNGKEILKSKDNTKPIKDKKNKILSEI